MSIFSRLRGRFKGYSLKRLFSSKRLQGMQEQAPRENHIIHNNPGIPLPYKKGEEGIWVRQFRNEVDRIGEENKRKEYATKLKSFRKSISPTKGEIGKVKSDVNNLSSIAVYDKKDPGRARRRVVAQGDRFWSQPGEEKQLALLRAMNKFIKYGKPKGRLNQSETLLFKVLEVAKKKRELNNVIPKISEIAAKARGEKSFENALNNLIYKNKAFDKRLLSKEYLTKVQNRVKRERGPRIRITENDPQEEGKKLLSTQLELAIGPRTLGLSPGQFGEIKNRAILNKKIKGHLEENFKTKVSGSTIRHNIAVSTKFWKKSYEEKQAALLRTMNRLQKRGKGLENLSTAEKTLLKIISSIGDNELLNKTKLEISNLAGTSKNEREFLRKLKEYAKFSPHINNNGQSN